MAFQTTSGSQREKWVMALLPATVILLIGFLYIAFSVHPKLTKAEDRFNRVSGGAVSPDMVFALKQQAKMLRKDRSEMKGTMSSVDNEVVEKSRSFQQLSLTAKHSAVTAVCQQQGVAILKDQSVDSMKVPALRMKSIEALKSLVPQDAVSFRELTLAADYVKIVKLLREIPEIPGVIPVSLELKKAQSTDSSTPTVSWTVGLLM